MKIGMVTACYKPVINGVTRMVALYKEQLEAAGHEVTVFTLGEPDPAGEEPGVIRSPAIPLGDTGYYFSFRYSEAAQERLAEMDIIHCHHLFMSVEMAHRYGRCPIVYTNHTRYDLYTGAYTPLPKPAADALMRQIWPDFTDYCDLVIAPSQSVARVMADFGVRQPIEVVPNGIELSLFDNPVDPLSKADLGISPDSDPLLCIYTGRLAPEKQLDLLLQQFAAAREQVWRLHLLLLGDGPQRQALLEKARSLGLEDYLLLPGGVTHEQVGRYLAAGDIFVTASVSEVHPLTVIEALAAGLPVVAVRSPGIQETVEDGVTGLLTDYPAGGLAAALVALGIDDELRWSMSRAARRSSRRFDVAHTVEQTLAIYEGLLERRPDLQRQREHGRWRRQRPRLQPLVEQLAWLLRPPG